MNKKQTVEIPEIKENTPSGITQFRTIVIPTTTLDINNAIAGVLFLFNFAKVFGALSSFANPYNIRLVLNNAELQADAAEDKTTKLIILAAAAIPIELNTVTNGLCVGSMIFQG